MSGWSKKEKKLIELLNLQYYEKTMFGDKNYSKDSITWKNISSKVGWPAVYCRRKWHDIKHFYFKLKYMIKIGRVTEDGVRMHPQAAKYFDGRLEFLDPSISEISHAALSNTAHLLFASLFGEEAVASTNNVHVGFVDFDVTLSKSRQVTKVYKRETGPKLVRILPKTKPATEEVYPIDDDSNNGEVFQFDASSSKQPKKNEEPKLKKGLAGCNLAQFLVKYTNTNIEKDQSGDLKEYMNDLAKVLCNRLAPRKRKAFLSQIDLIVSEMLEVA